MGYRTKRFGEETELLAFSLNVLETEATKNMGWLGGRKATGHVS